MRLLFLCFLLGITVTVQGQFQDKVELPVEEYQSMIPTPESYLGYPVGEWHVRHDQLAGYMNVLAESSERIKIREFGKTHEQRPLLLLEITSVENHSRLDEIKRNHQILTDPSRSHTLDVSNMPAVVWMGYSVHGNEPSGANASIMVAYYLAASNSSFVDSVLKETVVLIDPSFNPDGLSRFAQWANMHRGMTIHPDPNHREHNEGWPAGRTNHYWFDLNRDWLPIVHPESKARINIFHEWKPNVLTDHHEMGSNATFFFQPGIPSRTNPITPEENQTLTQALGDSHAAHFNRQQRLYYSKESFDDFYYGKGSTYPDVNGAVGILFEQARTRGKQIETEHGVLSFEFTIQNQITASFSTLRGVLKERIALLEYQRSFYKTALERADKDQRAGYVFSSSEDPVKAYKMAHVLSEHKIDIYQLTETLELSKGEFEARKAYYVPLDQPSYRLIQAFFEKTTQFEDSLFYDVSAWTMPLAYNLRYQEVSKRQSKNLSTQKITTWTSPKGVLHGDQKRPYAWVLPVEDYYIHNVLYQLLAQNVKVRIATEPFTSTINGVETFFDYGSLLIPAGTQTQDVMKLNSTIKSLVENYGIEGYAVQGGLTPSGIDLGSSAFEPLRKPNILLIGGESTSSYDVGEVWHLLDNKNEIPVTIIEAEEVASTNVQRYNVIIMVDGSYSRLGENGWRTIKEQVEKGAILIASGTVNRVLSAKKMIELTLVSVETSKEDKGSFAYAEYSNRRGAQQIGGTIFETKVDLTHPLGYGLPSSYLPVFRDHTLFYQPTKNKYATPLRYTESPLLAGYVSDNNLLTISSSAAVTIHRLGNGKIISILDNLAFRGFWLGSEKVLLNAIFWGSVIRSSTAE